jgi:endonuclease V-like protein UPF0215 family
VRRFTNVVGFDDSPFTRGFRGDVAVFGAVFSDLRLDGIVQGAVRRDGANAARVLADLVNGSRYREHVRLIMLDGITFAGFNVVSLRELAARTERPVLVVTRNAPDLPSIRRALLARVRGGRRKWRLIEDAGAVEPLAGLYVQREGLTIDEARWCVERFAIHGRMPEPVRVAHLVARAAGG